MAVTAETPPCSFSYRIEQQLHVAIEVTVRRITKAKGSHHTRKEKEELASLVVCTVAHSILTKSISNRSRNSFPSAAYLQAYADDSSSDQSDFLLVK